MDQDTQTPPQTTPIEPEKSSAGPIVGTVIVIILLAAGALYFWGAQLNKQDSNELPFIPGDGSSEAWVPPTSNSDEVTAIEDELGATDMDAFEQQMNADLEAIEASL